MSSQGQKIYATSPYGLLKRANHIGITVSNLQVSVAFYTAITGQTPVATDTWNSTGFASAKGQEKVKVKWATFRLENINIDLLQFEDPSTPSIRNQSTNPGGMHFCFEVDDLEEVYQRLNIAGIQFTGNIYTVQPDMVEQGAGTQVAFFQGPDGEHLEIMAPKGPFIRESVENGRYF